MNIHKFYPVQEPQPEELDESVLDAATNLIRRFSTIMQPGIVPAAALYQVTDDPRWLKLAPIRDGISRDFDMTIAGTTGDAAFVLNIGPGMAYAPNPVNIHAEVPYDLTNEVDLKLERIFISPSAPVQYNAANATATDALGNSTPYSTGSYGIPLNPKLPLGDPLGERLLEITYYIYIAYLSVVDTVSPTPPGPGDKYTINPISGKVDYTHWVDGYRVKVLTTNTPDLYRDIYLGTVNCNQIGITTINTNNRAEAYIPASIIRSKLDGALLPAAYNYATYVSLNEHINAVGDVNLVSLANPHGTTVTAAGATSQGPYADTPENFHVNGITDQIDIPPGPFYATASSTYLSPCVDLRSPVAGQAIYIYGKGYQSTSHYWSEVLNGPALELQELPLSAIRVDFPTGLRTAGYYYIYGERYTPVDPELTGLAIKAMWVGNTPEIFAQMVEDPANFLTPQQYPFAVCEFDGSAFTVRIDPQTGFTDLNYKMIDMRNYGTVGSEQLNTNKRYYSAGATAAQRDIFNIDHNVLISKELLIPGGITGGAVVTGGVTADIVTAPNVTAGVVYSPSFVGMVAYFAGSTTPPGWLLADGSVKSIAAYPALSTFLNGVYNVGTEGDGNFRLPKVNDGRFIRGTGGPNAAALGQYQADALQGHNHTISQDWTPNGGNSTGAISINLNYLYGTRVYNSSLPLTYGYGTVRIANETRPLNTAMTPFIKY